MSAIGRYFTLKDVTRSNMALRHGVINEPTPQNMVCIECVINHIVDPVKDKFPSVDISSFFRNEETNRLVGGAARSQHLSGEACDLDSPQNKDNNAIFDFIRTNMVYDQIIGEMPDENGVFSWVHVSYVSHPKINRNQVLIKLKKGYIPYGEWSKGMI